MKLEMNKPYVKEGYLYEKLERKKVKCKTCNRKCVIPPGKLGFCKTRKNIDGKLFTLEYGLASSIAFNPVEKKPLFHFWPGSTLLTMGSWSCTFTCPYHESGGTVSKF
ncbi:MAG: hypothetical protein QMD14_04015 [Candidatus Aenigmarchaeota archaeon]|nr:hypothetical protein [Candidatus Aenigmarchaeota archaeon]